jgi:hypothetical protein
MSEEPEPRVDPNEVPAIESGDMLEVTVKRPGYPGRLGDIVWQTAVTLRDGSEGLTPSAAKTLLLWLVRTKARRPKKRPGRPRRVEVDEGVARGVVALKDLGWTWSRIMDEFRFEDEATARRYYEDGKLLSS